MEQSRKGYRRINLPLKLYEDMKRLLESGKTPYKAMDKLAREAVNYMIKEEIEGGQR